MFIALSSTTMALTPIKISLDWLLNPHHAPLIIGIEQGFFREEGLDVTLVASIGSLEGCKQVSVQNIDFAITNEPQLLIQTQKGLALEAVCTLIPQPLEVFVSRVPLNELKGKRIGHCSSGVGFSSIVLKLRQYFLYKFLWSPKINTRRLQLEGVPGKAKILEVHETDITVNQKDPGKVLQGLVQKIKIKEYRLKGLVSINFNNLPLS